MTLTVTVDQSHRSLMDFHAMPTIATPDAASVTPSDQTTSAAAGSFASALAAASSSSASTSPASTSAAASGTQSGTAVQLGTVAATVAPAAVTPAVAPAVASSGSAATASASPSDTSAATDPNAAYWAMQPPAVQALQNISDPGQRYDAGMALAQQGYKIDVPIMLWGWNPVQTMQFRQNMGYTWVPSALQGPVQVAPGLTFPGLASYDPSSPPPGSILVSTNFLNPIVSTTS